MDRFNKIWTTAVATVLTAVGVIIILDIADPPVIGIFIYSAVYTLMMAVAFLFHIIAHEGGHCIGGLLSGYEFASFRVFNIMIVKRDGKYLRKKFHMVGTGGQCLMAPPQPYRPDFPYRLYNLAGGLTNLIIAGICIALCLPMVDSWLNPDGFGGFPSGGLESVWALLILFPLVEAGIYCGVINLVPMIIGGVANDGWNLKNLGKDPESRRIFWLLLDVMAMINGGGQFRDMPEEWFALDGTPEAKTGETTSSKPGFNNTFQFALGVYRFNYLVDTGRLEEAADLAQEILQSGGKVPQVYRYELLCETIFLELIGEGRLDWVERRYTPELERYIKATDSYPHRQRLHYAMAMLYHHNQDAAAKALERFADACKTYPNQGEISSEWESIGLVDCKLAEVNALAQQEAEEELEATTAKEADGESSEETVRI
jgi:hypothetical protein